MSRTPHKSSRPEDLSLSRPDSYLSASSLGRSTRPMLAPGSPLSMPPRHRRHRPHPLTVFAWVLVLAGLLLLADVGVTLVWQEPFTAVYAHFRQESLSGDLSALDRAKPPPAAVVALGRMHEERRRVDYLAAALQRHAKFGSAVGIIHIPTIGANYVVVKGTGTSELESGPGVYPETNFPGVPGTTAIAGHRTTYLAPFRHIDSLRPGQSILLDMPYAHFIYRVIGSRVVLPTDVSIIKPVGYSRLVLSACTPLFSASHRLIVFARLQSIEPLGVARVRGAPARLPGSPSKLEAGSAPVVSKSLHSLLLAPLSS
jgi:sortase A